MSDKENEAPCCHAATCMALLASAGSSQLRSEGMPWPEGMHIAQPAPLQSQTGQLEIALAGEQGRHKQCSRVSSA